MSASTTAIKQEPSTEKKGNSTVIDTLVEVATAASAAATAASEAATAAAKAAEAARAAAAKVAQLVESIKNEVNVQANQVPGSASNMNVESPSSQNDNQVSAPTNPEEVSISVGPRPLEQNEVEESSPTEEATAGSPTEEATAGSPSTSSTTTEHATSDNEQQDTSPAISMGLAPSSHEEGPTRNASSASAASAVLVDVQQQSIKSHGTTSQSSSSSSSTTTHMLEDSCGVMKMDLLELADYIEDIYIRTIKGDNSMNANNRGLIVAALGARCVELRGEAAQHNDLAKAADLVEETMVEVEKAMVEVEEAMVEKAMVEKAMVEKAMVEVEDAKAIVARIKLRTGKTDPDYWSAEKRELLVGKLRDADKLIKPK